MTPIKKDLSHLKTLKEKEERELSYARILVEAWAKLAQERGTLEHAVAGTSMRHSMGGKCARQVHYYLKEEPISNPFDLPGYWSTGLGSAVHEWWQTALKDAFPNVEIEKVVHIPDADSSGHADAWLPDEKISFELKSINGYGFKLMAEGGQAPRYGDVTQAALNGFALGAEKVVLIYLSLEAVSKNRASRYNLNEVERIAKEFHYTPDFFTKLAETEIERWAAIRAAGERTPRNIPDPEYVPNNRVVDPPTGRMEKKDGSPAGFAWQCGYCAWQTKCSDDLKSDQ